MLFDTKKLISLENDRKTPFILCGFPYTGKSFIAGQLLEHADLRFVSIDNIDWNSNKLPDADEWGQIFNESYNQTKHALMDGKNVLYDSTNQTVASRDKLREVARPVDVDTKVVFVKSSMENLRKRWEENKQNRRRPVVSKELVQHTIDMFEEPEEWEHVTVIEN